MTRYRVRKEYRRTRLNRRGAFTLVEILVALAVMMLMMTIILVPINMGLDMFHIGKARSEVQQANQLVINQLAAELKRAIHVYPNEAMPGVTDKMPYTSGSTPVDPYLIDGTSTRVANTSRIDFLLPAVDSLSGAVATPLQTNNYVVTYYAGRLKPYKDDGVTDNPYDVYSNPIVLWRAQYPLTVANTKDQLKGEPTKLLAASVFDPSNAATSSSSHTQLTPRDMVLVAPNAEATAPDYQPSSSFTTDDSNNDGKIDRVTISLLLGKYDSIGADTNSHKIRSTQTVDLPNVE